MRMRETFFSALGKRGFGHALRRRPSVFGMDLRTHAILGTALGMMGANDQGFGSVRVVLRRRGRKQSAEDLQSLRA